jgi:hypothetical protein
LTEVAKICARLVLLLIMPMSLALLTSSFLSFLDKTRELSAICADVASPVPHPTTNPPTRVSS